jgi:hypothetical protein
MALEWRKMALYSLEGVLVVVVGLNFSPQTQTQREGKTMGVHGP